MIQDIQPRRFFNRYEPCHAQSGDYVLAYHDGGLLVRDGEELGFPTYQEYLACGQSGVAYLFSVDEERYFLAGILDEFTMEGYHICPMQGVRRYAPGASKDKILAAATGWHLYVWYRDNRFCGRCGRPTVHDSRERMLRCSCGNMVFPKIAPAVIVAVTRGDQILLTRYAGRAYTRYALIAGFTEIGETAEETVRREVMEEVGLRVRNITYYRSQPWGFDSNLLLGFFCEADGASEICMDRKELAEAEWVRRGDMPVYEERLSLTHEMMDVFRNRENIKDVKMFS